MTKSEIYFFSFIWHRSTVVWVRNRQRTHTTAIMTMKKSRAHRVSPVAIKRRQLWMAASVWAAAVSIIHRWNRTHHCRSSQSTAWIITIVRHRLLRWPQLSLATSAVRPAYRAWAHRRLRWPACHRRHHMARPICQPLHITIIICIKHRLCIHITIITTLIHCSISIIIIQQQMTGIKRRPPLQPHPPIQWTIWIILATINIISCIMQRLIEMMLLLLPPPPQVMMTINCYIAMIGGGGDNVLAKEDEWKKTTTTTLTMNMHSENIFNFVIIVPAKREKNNDT